MYLAYITYLLVFLVFYPFIVYPILLWILSIFGSRNLKTNSNYLPGITVLVAAYNEEDTIEACIRSINNSDYELSKIKIIVGSDGSDDRTIEILSKLKNEFDNLDFHQLDRGGKNNVLNQLLPKVETELVYIMDADLRVNPNTISKLVNNISDESVGASFSKFKMETITGGESGGEGEGIYQKFEAFLRNKESKIKSNINPIGATLYKKSLLDEIPNDLYCDDLFYMSLVNNSGKRVIYDGDVEIKEVREKELGLEYNRRIRLVSGGLATLFHFPKLTLAPNLLSFFVWSHKLVRYFSPFYLIALLIISFITVDENIRIISGGLLSIILLSYIIGLFLQKLKLPLSIFKIPIFYVVMQISFIAGIFRWIKGSQNAIWNRSGLESEE